MKKDRKEMVVIIIIIITMSYLIIVIIMSYPLLLIPKRGIEPQHPPNLPHRPILRFPCPM